MGQDEFTKLYKYIEKRLDGIEQKIDSKANASGVQQILNILDGVAKQQETEEHERLSMSSQLDRLQLRLDRLDPKSV